MSLRKITSNRRTLIRACFICGKTFITTASTPFMRQMTNVNGKKQATVYFCSEGCKKSSYKRVGWFDGKADIRRDEREAKRDVKEKNRRYYLAHAEEIKAKKRKKYQENKEEYLLNQKYNREKRKLCEKDKNNE